MLDFKCLTYQRKGSICYLTLNRPEKLNALNAELLSEFRQALDAIDTDPEVRVVILTGAGRAFSAGFDIERDPGQPDPQQAGADAWREHLKSHIETFMMVWNPERPRHCGRKRLCPGGRMRAGAGVRHQDRVRAGSAGRARDQGWSGTTPPNHSL